MKDIQKQFDRLAECKDSDEEIIYVGRGKAIEAVEEMKQVLVGIEKEVEQRRLVFAPSPNIERLLGDLKWFGEIVVCGYEKTADTDEATERNAIDGRETKKIYADNGMIEVVDIRNLATKDKGSDIEVGSGRISGCTFLLDRTLILCDQDNCKLLHYSREFKYIYELKLSSEPRDATGTSNNDVAVTMPGELIQFVSIYDGFSKLFSGGLKLGRTISLYRECYGIHHLNNKLYVTCHDKGSGREVVVLDLSGRVLMCIGHNGTGDGFMFDRPNYICVHMSESRIYVSDEEAGTITCLNQEWQVMYRSKLEGVRSPQGVCMASGGCLLVSDKCSNNVLVLTEAGSVIC